MSPKRALATVAVALLTALVACGGDTGTLVGFVRDEPLQVGSVSMTEERVGLEPQPFTFVAAPGELLVVFFGYTYCPDICPTSLADLRAALRRIGTDAELVDVAFVTIDPERDTIDRLDAFLASYVDRYHALRTLDEAELEHVKDAFLASSSVTLDENGQVEVSHTATTYVVDDKGQVVDEMPFGIGADGMENDLRILLAATKGGTS